ncbi:MAG: BTAD domain-containing putative transcriptional regulator, partial [Alphaproteobacteria bacterium]
MQATNSGNNSPIFELRLLGGFELRAPDGAPVRLTSAKARALLAYLACCSDRQAERAKIAALLWSDRGEAQARASLRQTLSVLRKALGSAGEDMLVVSSGAIGIGPDALDVDIAEFESLVSSDRRDDLEQAIGLYRGPFLDGFEARAEPFEEWSSALRARLAESAAGAMITLISLFEAEEAHDSALPFALKLVNIDPLREDAHRTAMRLYQRAGRWNEALRQYQDCAAVLDADLGVEPQEETRALYEEILARRDGAAPAPAPPVAAQQEDGRPSVAVLPFDNLGDDPAQGTFSDGITEDIITELSRFPGLLVIARNSTFAFKGRAVTLNDIGSDLGVRYVVKGSVRKSGNRVRVTAQLIEAESGRHVWAERYDRELTDVFALQDELTRGIVAVLPGRVEESEARKVARKPPEDMAAYELLSAGKILHHRFTKEDCVKALALIERAIALDPDYAAAHAWKACLLGQALGRGFLPDPKALFNSAAESVARALRLDENEVEAHRIQAEIAMATKRLDSAGQHNARALLLNPNDPRLLAQKGELLTWLGDAAEAVGWVRMAMRLDPYSAHGWAHLLGRALMMSGSYAEAAEAFLKCAFPRFGYHADAAGCYAALGRDQ